MHTNPVEAAFGRAVANARREKGLTQRQLADALHISRPIVANIESGRQRVYLSVALSLASHLAIDLVDLGHAGRATFKEKGDSSLSPETLANARSEIERLLRKEGES